MTLRKILSAATVLALTWAPAHAQTLCERVVTNTASYETSHAGSASAYAQYANTYLNSLGTNGAWSDVTYNDRVYMQSWSPMTHINRLNYMVRAFCLTGSSLRGNTNLYNGIVRAMNYWYATNPRPLNWFYEKVSWPTSLGASMCLMQKGPRALPDSTVQNLCARIVEVGGTPEERGSQGTAANKMMIAHQWIYRTALQGNEEQLRYAVAQFFLPVHYNHGENQRQGLQADWGYLQHGPQLYIGGYGGTILTCIEIMNLIDGTGLEDEYANCIKYVSDFFRQSYLPTIRGQYRSWNTIGRSLVAQGALYCSSDAQYASSMQSVDTEHAQIYSRAYQRLRGSASAGYGLSAYDHNYWNCDYYLHQRSGYSMDVRMVSTRTYRCENGNSQNLLGYFLCDGSTWISRLGNEFDQIYPVWDWAHIPGTTAPALERSAIPLPDAWGQYGQDDFAGGVSDSVYGVAALHYLDQNFGINSSAQKSYFFFDNEVVCLGSKLKSTNSADLHTTVNQCLLGSYSVQTETADGTHQTLTLGEHNYTDLRWLNHNSITYVFPENANVTVRNNSQSGRWSELDVADQNTALQTKNVMRAWINHGSRPNDGRYAYYIMPATSSIATAKQNLDSLSYVNTDKVQAVCNYTLGIVQAVFHQAARVQFAGGIEVSAEQPCVAMFTGIDSARVQAYVADPTHQLDAVRLYATLPGLNHSKQIDCALDTATIYRGRTTQQVIDAATPDSLYTPLTQLRFETASVRLNAAAGFEYRPTLSLAPADATPQEFTYGLVGDSAVATVTESGMVRAMQSGTVRLWVRSNEGLSDTCTINVGDELTAYEPVADAYVSQATPSGTFGLADELCVKKSSANDNYTSYLRFNLNNIKTALGSDTTGVHAQLSLYLKEAQANTPNINWNLYPSTSTRWSETAVRYTTAPQMTTTNLLDAQPGRLVGDGSNYVVFDVSSYLKQQMQAGKTLITLCLTQNLSDGSGLTLTKFASREAAGTALHPLLLVSRTTTDAMDHNGDGEVNLPDAVIVINKIIAGDSSDLSTYDHNNDGEINLPDAVMIINRVAGN